MQARKHFLDSIESTPLAIGFVVIAGFFSAVMALCVKLAATALPIPMILLSRFLVSWLICLATTSLQSRFKATVRSFHPKLQITRALIGSASLICFFYATTYLSLALSTVLFSMAPLFVPIIAKIWQRVSFHRPLWWAMLLGFGGMIVLLHPHGHASVTGAVLGLLSGLGAAAVTFSNRLLSYDETTDTTLFYDFTIGLIISIIWLSAGHGHVVFSWHNLGYLLIIGMSGYAYLYFSVASTRYAPVRLSAPFMYSATLFGLLCDWLFWGVYPGVFGFVGIMLIVIAGFLMLRAYPDPQIDS